MGQMMLISAYQHNIHSTTAFALRFSLHCQVFAFSSLVLLALLLLPIGKWFYELGLTYGLELSSIALFIIFINNL